MPSQNRMLTLVCFRAGRGYLEPGGFSQRLQKMERDTASPSEKETALFGAATLGAEIPMTRPCLTDPLSDEPEFLGLSWGIWSWS
jgi:hypothetical protein